MEGKGSVENSNVGGFIFSWDEFVLQTDDWRFVFEAQQYRRGSPDMTLLFMVTW